MRINIFSGYEAVYEERSNIKEGQVTARALRGMVSLKPQQVICLDNAFGGNEQLKTNTVLEMRDHESKFMTV